MAKGHLLVSLLGLSCLSISSFVDYYQTLFGPALNSLSENALNSAFVRNNTKGLLATSLGGAGLYSAYKIYSTISKRIAKGKLFLELGLFKKHQPVDSIELIFVDDPGPKDIVLKRGAICVATDTELTFKELIEKLMGEYPVHIRMALKDPFSNTKNFWQSLQDLRNPPIAPVDIFYKPKRSVIISMRTPTGEWKHSYETININTPLRQFTDKKIVLNFFVYIMGVLDKAILPEIQNIVIDITNPTQ